MLTLAPPARRRRKGNRSTSAKSQRKEATGIEGSAAGQPGGSSQTSSGGRLQNHLPNLDSCKQTVRKEVKDPRFQCLPPEEEEGNVEYKLRVKEPNPARLQQLVRTHKALFVSGGRWA